jgi:hypothetical protein
LTTLIAKHSLPILSSINQKCGRYFCNYCLKGSYQINVDSLTKPNDLTTSSQGFSQASTCNSSESEKEKSKDKSKSKNLLKDWCCPWCLNDCFCSRCIREEQIVKLITTFFYYEGDLQELLINILSFHPILKALKNNVVLSNLEVKDFSFQERQCKNSKGSSSTENGEAILGLSKKHIRLSKKGKFESSKNAKKNKSISIIKSKSVEKLDKLQDFDNKVQQLDQLVESCLAVKEEYRKLQNILSEKIIPKSIIHTNKNTNESNNFTKKSVGRPKKSKSSSRNIREIVLSEEEESMKTLRSINSINVTMKDPSKPKKKNKKFKKVVEDGKRIIKSLDSINLLRRKRRLR